MPAPDFPDTIPAEDTDDLAKPWRLVDGSGTTQDYARYRAVRQAMYDAPASAAIYDRKGDGEWWLFETLLREG